MMRINVKSTGSVNLPSPYTPEMKISTLKTYFEPDNAFPPCDTILSHLTNLQF